MTNTLSITYLPVSCGDAIHIRFFGTNNRYHNILIDGGFKKTYQDYLEPLLQNIAQNPEEFLDLWIVTHYDRDHIGGVVAFAEDIAFNTPNHRSKKNLVTNFWYNRPLIASDSTERGLTEGISLSTYLADNDYPARDINNNIKTQEYFGIKITVLSPTPQQIQTYRHTAQEDAAERGLARENDYNTPISAFDIHDFDKDTDPINDSSIAILFEYQDYKGLFLADANPETIRQSLLRLPEVQQTGKIKLTQVKLGHHGSKHNTHIPLLQILDTQNYIFLANGENAYNLPTKLTMARILRNPKRNPTQTLNFHFNFDNSTLQSIITPEESTHYKVNTFFHNRGYTYKHK